MTAQKYKGLSDKEVSESRSKHGSNLLTPTKKTTLFHIFLEKFNDPIIKILIFVVILSLLITLFPVFFQDKALADCDFTETIGILFAIFLATGIAFWFERDAHKKFDVLTQVNDNDLVKVIRNGSYEEIPKKDVVVGDIVILEQGEEVPADGELLEAVSLQIDESTLTGEPLMDKTTDPQRFKPDATYPSNWVMRGSSVIDGHGIMEVKRVGDQTEYGKVAEKSTVKRDIETPLDHQLNRLAKLIGIIGFSLALIIFALLMYKDFLPNGALHHWNELSWWEITDRLLHYVMIAVAIMVMCIPEGLPMSITMSLALNMRRMLKTNNLVRKLHACESMGAITVICTDKTGTLTQNQMQVDQAFFGNMAAQVLGEDAQSKLIIEGIASNTTAFLNTTDAEKIKAMGNPTEAALLLWLHKQGVNYLEYRNNAKIIDQLTFSTERKFMATLVSSPVHEQPMLYLKGAPEIILNKCSLINVNGKIERIADHLQGIEEKFAALQSQAYRTLAFAYAVPRSKEAKNLLSSLEKEELIFLGFVAISDPLREEVPAAVNTCLNAGIEVKIVTGDTIGTAKEIARQIGIWNESDQLRNIISGPEFAALSDEEAKKRAKYLKVMCRARPSDKMRLVSLLQELGEVVAVTGDGTNDAPALNYANVGLSMGSGTAIAKEASDITLLDDSFNSIVTAVMWGRSLYQNIQRFILFQLTVNLSALLVVFFGSFSGQALPLTVIQILWVNLIMDTFAATALASLPPSNRVMNNKPRKQRDFIISDKMFAYILIVGSAFAAILLLFMHHFADANGELSLDALSAFFTIFVFLQFWNIFNAKAFASGKSAFHDLRHSWGFLLITAVILLGQILIVQFGGAAFRTTPLSLSDWLVILGGTSLVLWIGEIIRLIKNKLH